MRRYNGVKELLVNGLKASMCFLVFLGLAMIPVDSAYAQVSIEQQFMEAVEDLTLEAKVELIGLLRDPGDLGEALEEFGVSPGLADRLEGSLANERELHKIYQISAKIETIDDQLEAKLARIKDHQVRKAEKTIAKALAKTAKVLAKAEETVEKDEEKEEDKEDKKDKDKDK